MKTQVLQTKQGIIVKINTNCVTFNRIFSRLEKQIGKLHHLGVDGDYSVFCDRHHSKNQSSRLAGWGVGFPTKSARLAQSVATKKLVALADRMGMRNSFLPPNWVAMVRKQFSVSAALLRYAFSPNDYTAVPTNYPK